MKHNSARNGTLKPLDEMEKRYIQKALDKLSGNLTQTAKTARNLPLDSQKKNQGIRSKIDHPFKMDHPV